MGAGGFLARMLLGMPVVALQLLVEAVALATVARQKARAGEQPWGQRIERISVEWLDEVLKQNDLLAASGRVSAYELERFGELGQMSAVYLVKLTYAAGLEGPHTVVLKTTLPEMKNRLMNRVFGVFEREILSYRLPAPSAGLLRPACYYAEQQPCTGSAILLMAYLEDWRGSVPYTKLSPDDMERAVKAVAHFHSTNWGKVDLDTKGLETSLDVLQHTLGPVCAMTWKGAREVMATLVDTETLSLLDCYMAHQQKVCEVLLSGARTMIHGDLNSNNLFWHDPLDQVCAIDWQSTRIGSWAEDLGYLMVIGFSQEDYAQHGERLCAVYKDQLRAQGISISDESFKRDYTLGALHGIVMMVIGAKIIDEDKDPQLYALFRQTIVAWGHAMKQLDAQHVLGTVIQAS